MLRIDAIRLACVSGTPLGRLVVPLVCRNRAMSSGRGGSGIARPAAGSPSPSRRTRPLRRRGGGPDRQAERAGHVADGCAPGGAMTRAAPDVFEVEAELLGLVRRVERRRDQAGRRHGQERRQVFQAVGQHDGDGLARLEPRLPQHGRQRLDLLGQATVGRGEPSSGRITA